MEKKDGKESKARKARERGEGMVHTNTGEGECHGKS